MTSSGLKVTPIDDQWAFRNLFNIARNHYVTARICLDNGMVESGCLLAQQSIEGYLKAIAHARNHIGPQLYYFANRDDPSQVGKTRIWGHNLTDLVQDLLADNSALNVLILNKQMKDFLEQLTDSYEPMRYGQATSSIVFGVLVQQLDEAIQTLDGIYHKKMSLKTETKLYVPKSLQDIFLHKNKVFPKPKITSFSMSSLAPGVDLSSLEGKFNFDNAKVVQSAGAVMNNKNGKSDK